PPSRRELPRRTAPTHRRPRPKSSPESSATTRRKPAGSSVQNRPARPNSAARLIEVETVSPTSNPPVPTPSQSREATAAPTTDCTPPTRVRRCAIDQTDPSRPHAYPSPCAPTLRRGIDRSRTVYGSIGHP